MQQFVPQGNLVALQQAPAPVNQLLPQQHVPPRPIIRAQREDDPPPLARPAQLVLRAPFVKIPSPEELGVARARAPEISSINWTDVHTRLDRMGANCFHLEKLSGSCRVTCLLPTGQQGRSRRIEAEAETEAEAVRTALAKAEEFTRTR